MVSKVLPFICPFCGAKNALRVEKGKGIMCRVCLTPIGLLAGFKLPRVAVEEKIPIKENVVVVEDFQRWINSIAVGKLDFQHNSIVVGLSNGDLNIIKLFYDPGSNRFVKWKVGRMRLGSEVVRVILEDLDNDNIHEIIALDSSSNLVIGSYERMFRRKELDVKDITVSNLYFTGKSSVIFINGNRELVSLDPVSSNIFRYRLRELREGGPINLIVGTDFDGDGQDELFIVQSNIKLFTLDIVTKRFKKREISCKEFETFRNNIVSLIPVDIDNDNKWELIVATEKTVSCYKHMYDDLLWRQNYDDIVNIVMGDPNNDDEYEIAVFMKNGNIKLLSLRGDEKKAIKVNLDDFEKISCGTVGDADNDGWEELLLGTNKGKLIMVKFPPAIC